MTIIESPQNSRIKKIKDLVRSGKAFMIEGETMLEEALKSGMNVLTVLYDGQRSKRPEGDLKNADVIEVTDRVISHLSDVKTPQGIISVLEKRNAELKLEEKARVIILDRIRDPGNLGTIIRTAEALQVEGIILLGCADVFSPKVIRSTMGAVFRVPFLLESDLSGLIPKLKAKGFKVLAAALTESSIDLKSFDFPEKCAVIFGNEAGGIEKDTLNQCDETVRISMRGGAESLNVASAAAIFLWEMTKGSEDFGADL